MSASADRTISFKVLGAVRYVRTPALRVTFHIRYVLAKDRVDFVHNCRYLGRASPREKDAKLVTAESGDDVNVSDVVFDHLGERFEKLIALVMAQGVIDAFEVIDVYVYKAECFRKSGRAADFFGDYLSEISGIVNSGHWIDSRQHLLVGLCNAKS